MFPNIAFVGWMARLSNGEMVKEEPPIPGEKSSWQKLLDRLGEEDLKMVALSIQYMSRTVNAMSYKECDGYYQATDQHLSLFGEQQSLRRGVGSVIGDKVFIVWVDNNGQVWADVRPLESEKIHTTLRDT